MFIKFMDLGVRYDNFFAPLHRQMQYEVWTDLYKVYTEYLPDYPVNDARVTFEELS